MEDVSSLSTVNTESVSPLSGMSLFVETLCRDNPPLSSATAFVVANSEERLFLVTNRHVISGRAGATNKPLSSTGATPDSIRVHFHRSTSGGWLPLRVPVVDSDGQPLWHEHPELNRRVDVVGLPIDPPSECYLPHYGLSRRALELPLDIAKPISIVGFPFGVRVAGGWPVWVQGTVASDPALDFDDLPVFLIDSRTRPGSSGSPALHYYPKGSSVRMRAATALAVNQDIWELVGVYSGRINEQSDIGLLWKREALWQVVNAGNRPEEGWDTPVDVRV